MPEQTPMYIKDCQIVENKWLTLPADFEGKLPEGNLLLSLNTWLAHKENFPENSTIGLWLNGEDEAENIASQVNNFPVIAVKFPTFMDGRGFSLAKLLRERCGFTGELRAIGHVIRDQLFFLSRCGFNSFELSPNTDLQQAKESLRDFTESYQGAVDTVEPLFKRQSL